jgi:DNA polymerase III epsilon subunit-like protein
MHYLFFDLETSGLITKRGGKWFQLKYMPRIVSVCWTLTDENNEVIDHSYYIIKPIGFEIPQESINVHGITREIAMRDGILFNRMILKLKRLISKYNKNNLTLVAHNMDFDFNVLKSELLRIQYQTFIKKIDEFKRICTKEDTIEYCKCEPFKWGKWKWPRLEELHQKCFNKPVENAHCAEDDVNALRACFFHLKDANDFQHNWM